MSITLGSLVGPLQIAAVVHIAHIHPDNHSCVLRVEKDDFGKMGTLPRIKNICRINRKPFVTGFKKMSSWKKNCIVSKLNH